MNMTSPHTPAINGSISRLSKDDMYYCRPENYLMIFSASVLTDPVIMKPPQLQNSGATNGAQLFLDLSLKT